MTQKVSLVTGASSGIGTAVAHQLADCGYQVFAAGRNEQRTNALRDYSTHIQTWVGNLDSPQTCASLVADCVGHYGGIDLLVNNAGIYHPANAEETSDDAWSSTIAVNLSAVFYLSRDALPHLRKSRGAIINIASDWGLQGGKNAVAYCASKGGVVLMTRAMAMDHAHEGIRVNAICPGDVETPMLYADGKVRGIGAAETLAEAAEASPTGRVTSADEVAALVLYLASDVAEQITGAAIPIDGGNTA